MVDTAIKAGKRAKRPNYPTDFKKRLAKAACAPDVSVSQLALEHEINVNMLFKWRRQYRAGLFDAQAVEPARLLPVSLLDEHPVATPPSISAAPTGIIEIRLGGASIRIEGHANAATLRVVLQSLRS